MSFRNLINQLFDTAFKGYGQMVKKAYGNDTVDVTVQLHAQTDKAWAVSDGKGEIIWIPKSQAELELDAGVGRRTYTLTCAEWLALEKGLI